MYDVKTGREDTSFNANCAKNYCVLPPKKFSPHIYFGSMCVVQCIQNNLTPYWTKMVIAVYLLATSDTQHLLYLAQFPALISLYQINTDTCIPILLNHHFFNLLKPNGHVMHHQLNIQQLYALPTLYFCVLYLSENKQRLVPLTA